MDTFLSRRELLKMLGAASVATAGNRALQAQTAAPAALAVGLVSRHVQWTSLEDAIDIAARLGFDSIEWNVRAGGHIEPSKVEQDLPRAVERTRKAGLAVTMITTSIQDAQSPHVQAILHTAGGLGIRYYRGGQYFRYDDQRDPWQQLQELKPRVAGLAALNEQYGTTVAYHTHSGRGLIGGAIWDFWEVVRGFDPKLVGLNYDIGHAVARNGVGWAETARLASRHISALAIKDVRWERDAKRGWRTEFVPIGEGMIDLEQMFAIFRNSAFNGPVNIHYEHNDLLGTDVGKWQLSMSRERFMELVAADLRRVREAIRESAQ